MSFAQLKLKAREERRLRAGHAWVFSNEVDVASTPLTQFAAGEYANVVDHGGRALGTAAVNPGSLICARMVSRRADRALDATTIRARLAGALALRERCRLEGCYRLVYGESDGLPGLVVDRHAQVLAIQVSTAGMEQHTEAVLDALIALLSPRAVVLRNDSPGRELEGLPRSVSWIHGEAMDQAEIVENGVHFIIDPGGGQKTGWFYDQRMNRARVAAYAREARVLDLFSYLGGFGIQAAAAGAKAVVCVDGSATALEGVARSAGRNAVDARVRALRGDVFEVMKAMLDEGERFDIVVTDPPAFARRKRDLAAATEAYTRLNRQAMKLLVPDGLLLAASCSSHVTRKLLNDCLRQAGRGAGRTLLELESGRQGPDHPVHLAMPETEYLKASLVMARS